MLLECLQPSLLALDCTLPRRNMMEGAANSDYRGMAQVYQMFRCQVCCFLVIKSYLIDIVLLREGTIDDHKRDTLLFQGQQMSTFTARVFRHERHKNKAVHLLGLQCLNRLNFSLHIRSARQDNIIALGPQYILNTFDDWQEEIAYDRCEHNTDSGSFPLDHTASNRIRAVLQFLHGTQYALSFGLSDILYI